MLGGAWLRRQDRADRRGRHAQAAKLMPGADFIEYEGEPHGLFITAKDRLNADLLTFLRG